MAYYSGQASSYEELRDVLLSVCIDHGWVINAGAICKYNFGVKIAYSQSRGLALTGGVIEENIFTNPSPLTIYSAGIRGFAPTVFPVDYNIHIFEHEVYLVFKHSINKFEWITFGMNENNLWLSAACRETYNNNWLKIAISAPNLSSLYACPAPFWQSATWYPGVGHNSYICSNNFGWYPLAQDSNGIGSDHLLPMIQRMPSNWNSESVFLPISIYQKVAESKVLQTHSLSHARYLRIDHYEPEQIITLGADQWKIYPFYCKNAAQRDGGTSIEHTGTFGWAIRYDGS